MTDNDVCGNATRKALSSAENRKRPPQHSFDRSDDQNHDYDVGTSDQQAPDNDDDWYSPMHFAMHIGLLCNQTTETVELDICAFIARRPGTEHVVGDYAYFDRSLFPPPKGAPFDDKSFGGLRVALLNAARGAGFSLVSDGSRSKFKSTVTKCPLLSGPPIGMKVFMCERYRIYREAKREGPRQRRRTTKLALCPEDTCSFRLSVFADGCGYYVKRGAGKTKHCRHAKRDPSEIPLRKAQIEAIEESKLMKPREFLSQARLEMFEIERLLLSGNRNKVDLAPYLESIRSLRKAIQGDDAVEATTDNAKQGQP
ncbi:hypothetical protein ACA910_006649 [Epithemia clementina (nom. ined.)]